MIVDNIQLHSAKAINYKTFKPINYILLKRLNLRTTYYLDVYTHKLHITYMFAPMNYISLTRLHLQTTYYLQGTTRSTCAAKSIDKGSEQ